jgi:quinol monooxygenase YgiN
MTRNFVSLCRRLLVVASLFAFSTPGWAQANIRTVLLVKVKQGHDDSWKDAVKDYVATVRKAGSEEQFTMWDSQTGPSLHAVVWYSTKWKELGEENPKLKPVESDIETLFRRLDADTDSIETWVDEMQPELMIRSNQIPPYVRTGRTRVLPGKMEEFKALLRDQILPAYKKAGATDYGVAVARFGTPSNETHSYLGVNGWGDFDSTIGIEKGMTPGEWKAFQAKVGTLVEWTQWDLWKFEPDLSYLVPAK